MSSVSPLVRISGYLSTFQATIYRMFLRPSDAATTRASIAVWFLSDSISSVQLGKKLVEGFVVSCFMLASKATEVLRGLSLRPHLTWQ